jgi:prevent-host-death family protein
VKVNMLEAKNQLSRLVKQALDGEDVIIASNGEPMVRLVPVARKGRLRGWGRLKHLAAGIDDAFAEDVDAAVARQLNDRA